MSCWAAGSVSDVKSVRDASTASAAPADFRVDREPFGFSCVDKAESAGSADAPPASVEEVEGLFDQLHPLLERIGFKRDDTAESAVRDLRRLAARSGATGREVAILRGICRRAEHALGTSRDDRHS